VETKKALPFIEKWNDKLDHWHRSRRLHQLRLEIERFVPVSPSPEGRG
jgi:hypothetical protein